MNRSTQAKVVSTLIALTLLASGAPIAIAMGLFSPPLAPPLAATLAPPQQSTTITFADPAFKTTWERTDLPVQNGKATRSWLWGPQSIFSGNEPWAESPGGQMTVQYFDKSRMEVGDPNGDRNSPWFVTNGLLVVEMMSGKIMKGTNSFTQTVPAAVPVAGDASASVNAPTYGSTANVASLEGNNRAPDRSGQPVNQILDRAGNVSTASKTQDQVVNVVYEATLGHNIPNVFWSFMNQTGVVYQNGQYVNDKVFDWVFAMGYPLTEPYWIQINVGGQDVWVVMQAYQRRILTYNPNNDPAFQVEMGNVGQAYYNWRYGQQGGVLPTATPAPAATGTPAPAALTLNPTSGAANTTINVSGKGYMPYAAVTINVSAANGYNQNVATAAADAAGNFSVYVTLATDVAKQPDVTITATGANGSPALSQKYTISHTPALVVAPVEVTSKGVVKLTGSDFTANTQLTINAYLVGQSNPIGTAIQVTTDGNGAFQQNYNLTGKAAVGAQYNVVATGPNNLTAQAPGAVKIVPQPIANVNPFSGPVGVSVTFGGSNWSPNRVLSIKLQGDDGRYAILNPVVTDGAGNFSTPVQIPADYATHTRVLLWAVDDTNGISVSSPYSIVNPAPPVPNPKLDVVPNPIQSNGSVTVYGSGYPAGQIVSIAIGTVGGPQGPAASVSSDVNGNFNSTFPFPSNLAAAGMVTVSGTSTDGTNANVNITVVNNSGGGGGGGTTPPSGLPLDIRVKYYGGPGQVTVGGTGWPAGQGLTAMVLASDGSVNQAMGTGTVKSDGSFQLSFDQNPSWAGRTDLNVKVTAANGANGTAYLPVTSIASAGNGSYTVTGANWPRNAKVTVSIVPASGGANLQLGSGTTDGNGVLRLNLVPPTSIKGNVKTVEVVADTQPYSASFTP